MTTENVKVNQYGQRYDEQCSKKQVNRLKWILADYFMAEQGIDPTNMGLYKVRLYASFKNLHNIPEKSYPLVGLIMEYFSKYDMKRDANGDWERKTKNKLPRELVALVQVDEPEDEAPKEPVKKTAKKKTTKKKAVKATARKAKPSDTAPIAAVTYTDLSPEERKQLAAMRADGFTMAEALEFLAI